MHYNGPKHLYTFHSFIHSFIHSYSFIISCQNATKHELGDAINSRVQWLYNNTTIKWYDKNRVQRVRRTGLQYYMFL